MGFERISIDPDRMQGLPCIRGTRVTVSAVLEQLAAGRSIDEVVEDFPSSSVQTRVRGDLEGGAIASVTPERIRLRSLPIASDEDRRRA